MVSYWGCFCGNTLPNHLSAQRPGEERCMSSGVSVLVCQSETPEPEWPLIFLTPPPPPSTEWAAASCQGGACLPEAGKPVACSQFLPYLPSWSGTIREIGGEREGSLITPGLRNKIQTEPGVCFAGGHCSMFLGIPGSLQLCAFYILFQFPFASIGQEVCARATYNPLNHWKTWTNVTNFQEVMGSGLA